MATKLKEFMEPPVGSLSVVDDNSYDVIEKSTLTVDVVQSVSTVPTAKQSEIIFNTTNNSFYYGIYSIGAALAHCTPSASNPTTMTYYDTATLTFTADEGYSLPETVYVDGADYVWSQSTGTLTLTRPTDDIAVTTEVVSALCFTAETAGSTIGLNLVGTPTLGQTFLYSYDMDIWHPFVVGESSITLANANDKVYFISRKASESSAIYYNFTMTGSISASGSIMNLVDCGLNDILTIPNNYCFYKLFNGCSALVSAPSLSATTLTNNCYQYMFNGCTNLTTMPNLPATSLTSYCYANMFTNCSALTNTQALTAETADYCYSYMFQNCTSLITMPQISSTTLATLCCQYMFSGCTSLITGTSISATTIGNYSCYYMFNVCTALTTSPSLSATTVGTWSYAYMFYNCTSLVTAPKLPSITLVSGSYYRMFWNCTSLIVSDSSGEGYTQSWVIPTSGTFTTTQSQLMFSGCAGTRSQGETMPGEAGVSYTYYTQNAPV